MQCHPLLPVAVTNLIAQTLKEKPQGGMGLNCELSLSKKLKGTLLVPMTEGTPGRAT